MQKVSKNNREQSTWLSACFESFILHAILLQGELICCFILQGDPNQNLRFLLAITLKICVFDLMLVKPKCVWEVYIYFENCKQTAEKSKWMYASQMHFGFTNMGSKVDRFRFITSQRVKNGTRTPCTCTLAYVGKHSVRKILPYWVGNSVSNLNVKVNIIMKKNSMNKHLLYVLLCSLMR